MPVIAASLARPWRVAWALFAGTAAVPAVAGGHFDVDDAAVLAPGRCQVEVWVLRPAGGAGNVSHVGPACRVGPFEVGWNVDHASSAAAGEGGPTTVGPQLKWVTDRLAPRLGVGVAAAVGSGRHGRAAGIAYGLLSWRATGSLLLHANAGVDWARDARRTGRVGASAEWATTERTTLLAERIRTGGQWTSRIGTRFAVGAATSIDLSGSRSEGGDAKGVALGINHEWSR